MLLLLACAPMPAPQGPLAQSPPLPFGFWGLNGFVYPSGLAGLRTRLGVTVFQTATMDPAWAVTRLLPMVKRAGLRVTLRLTGDHRRYTTPTGDFDVAAWEHVLATWKDSGVQPFVEDGTLAGHMLLDDIQNFEGRDPDAADLERMGRASKAVLPGLMTFVRERATAMPTPESGAYEAVDAAVNQYRAMDGDVVLYGMREVARAERLGLDVINGLNLLDGGDGSSGKPGYTAGKWAMSADEIRRYGGALLAVPACTMFLMWEYDDQERWADGTIGADWLERPDVEAALAALGEQAARRGR
jgi:hypothetical protein